MSTQPRADPPMAHRALGATQAARSRLHLAVVDGPDSGWVAAVQGRGLVVGRGHDAGLRLRDDQLSRMHLRIRERGGRAQVRDLGSANGSRLRRARRHPPGSSPRGWRRRTHPIRSRWRLLHPGDLVHAGACTVQLREHPALICPPPADTAPSRPEFARMLFPLLMGVGMVPMLLSTGTSPWRALLLILMALGMAAAILGPWLAQRRRRRIDGAGDEGEDADGTAEPAILRDPAALFLAAATSPTGDGRLDIGNADTRSERGRNRGARHHLRRPGTESGRISAPEPGSGLALVGSPSDTESLARYLVCQIAVRPRGHWRIHTPESWAWAHGLAAADQADEHLHVVDVRSSGTGQEVPQISPAPATRYLVLARHIGQVPPWCARIIEVRTGHNRRVCADWAQALCRTLGTAGGRTGIPRTVLLGDLIGCQSREAVLRRWQEADHGLSADIGTGAEGPVRLDLTSTGPHAVVAGTTGSGKSELLLAWVLALAAGYPPGDLTFLLVDYKGGATFAPVAALPHVLDVLTDLDAASTARALTGLQAELHRREHLFARAGAANLSEYRTYAAAASTGEPVPRLMVIVDEFRVMADEHPEHLAALVRLAAQGRSLGIHLVLATQRPAGAISPDMRANLTTRLCLRVLDQADSADTIGTGAAAELPAVPGRAILATETTTVFQSAWAGERDSVHTLVTRIGDAAESLYVTQPWRARLPAPWAPPLPERLTLAELPTPSSADPIQPTSSSTDLVTDAAPTRSPEPDARATLTWLRTDLPAEQRLGVASLRLPTSVLISGPPGCGRSTAAATIAAVALRSGIGVHVLADSALAPAGAPGLGTWSPTTDPRRARRLLDLLRRPSSPELLLVDDVESWCQALDESAGAGAGTDLIVAMVRRARRTGLSVVLTTSGPAHRWAAQVEQHLVLAPRDRAEATMLGVPKDLAAGGWPPGRGVLLTARDAVLGQVPLASFRNAPTWPTPPDPPLRLQPLPEHVPFSARPDPARLWLGVGGDEAEWIGRDLPTGGTWLILGSAGSGRTNVLEIIRAQLAQHDRSDVLLLDDADRLGPAEITRMETFLRTEEMCTIVATADPERLLNAYHELATRLRQADSVIALSPVSHHLLGLDIRADLDPAGPPGRGVLVEGGTSVPLQLAQFTSQHPAVPAAR